MEVEGLVIRNTGSWYTVLTDDGQELLCKVKGNFRIRKSNLRPTNPIAIGDRVRVDCPEQKGQNNKTEVTEEHNFKTKVTKEHILKTKVTEVTKEGQTSSSESSLDSSLSPVAHPAPEQVVKSSAPEQNLCSSVTSVSKKDLCSSVTSVLKPSAAPTPDLCSSVTSVFKPSAAPTPDLCSSVTSVLKPSAAPTPDLCSSVTSVLNPPAANTSVPLFISYLYDRRNYIIRRSQNLSRQCHILAANVDQAVLIVTVAHPQTSTTFVDRFLASAEAYDVPVILLFNKSDLLTPEERQYQQYLIDVYTDIGYTCIACSAIDPSTIAPLLPLLQQRITLLSGNSGVGKSTLLNNIIPGLNIRTAPLSAAHDTGQHTTTFSAMYRLEGGTFIIDTPGIKGFGTLDFQPAEVSHYFPEIFRLSHDCRFSDCTHTHEPGCAVLQALEEKRLAPSRYESYLSILDDHEESKYRPAF